MPYAATSLPRGTYVLGGPGPVQGEAPGDAFIRGQRDIQKQREQELIRQQRQQQMQIRAQQEQRNQEKYKQQRELASRIANIDPRFASPGVLTPGQVGGVHPVEPPSTLAAGLQPPSGVGAAVEAPTGRIAPAATQPEVPGLRTPEVNAGSRRGSRFQEDIRQLGEKMEVARRVSNVTRGLTMGKYGPMGNLLGGAVGYFVDNPEEEARRTAIRDALNWFQDGRNQQWLLQNPELLDQAEADPVGFVAQYGGTTQQEHQTQQGAQQPSAGLRQQPSGAAGRTSPVQNTLRQAAARDMDLSAFYIRNPDRVFLDAEEISTRRQYLDDRYNAYRMSGDIQGLVTLRNEYAQLARDEQMVNGQMAIVGIQNQNFGPYQQLLQQRFPSTTVEVRPYTDGTMDVFVGGESQYPEGNRPTFGEVLQQLASAYNRDYINQQEGQRELRGVYNKEFLTHIAKERAEHRVSEGKAEKIGETPDGDPIIQQIINGVPQTFVLQAVNVEDPVTGGNRVEVRQLRVDSSLASMGR